MTDDREDEGSEPGQTKGLRKDGKPFKEGNLREDGSYEVGRNRTPVEHRFAKGDGRRRGKRPKGSRSLDKIWRDQLEKKRTINGRTQRTLEWIVEGTSNRAITRSDRAAEMILAQAERLERKKERGLALSDREMIDAWLAQRAVDGTGEVTDDADAPLPDEEADEQKGDDDADQ